MTSDESKQRQATSLEEVREAFQGAAAAEEAEMKAILSRADYDTRLAVVAWAMRHIVAHAREGGSFQHLIYVRLGFAMDAYSTLYRAGGMTISDEFTITEPGQEDAAMAARLVDSLRPDPNKPAPIMKGGEEPWLTVVGASWRLTELSRALAAEQEIRGRIEAELKAIHDSGYVLPKEG